ncbi:MAG: DivIVA domain-containing protein, partial [Erysipelotrichaceae bacterium]|nr:DivIVA domain-containing protein [Erysipelotrichaceae bacterium]
MTVDSRFRSRRHDYERLKQDEEKESLKAENQMLHDQISRYQTQIKAANEQLVMLKQRYQMLINELSMREKAAEEISRLALKEANLIIETAQGNADLIIQEALGSAKMVFIEINRLTTQTQEMRSEIQGKLHSMDQLLDTFKIPEISNLDYLSDEAKAPFIKKEDKK